MATDPTDDELFAFVDALLSDLGDQLRHPSVLAQAIADNRELWVMLYRVGHDIEVAGEPA